MKKHAFVLAALIGAASAQAQVYGTVAGGSTHWNVDCAGTTSCDSGDSGIKFAGGYKFGNGIAMELGYINFGKFRASAGTTGIEAKPTAVTLAAAFALPLGADWGFNARLGFAQVKTKVNAVVGTLTGSKSESKGSAYAGLGLTYKLNEALKFELGYDATQSKFAGEKGGVHLISLGATYAF